MTASHDLDRQLASWFDAEATRSAPHGLLERSLERVDDTVQRPGWLVRDRGRSPQRMRRPGTAPAWAGRLFAITAVLVVVAIGAGLLFRFSPAVVEGPSGAPSTSPTPSTTIAPSSSPSPSPAATARPPAVIAYIKDVYRTGVPMDETGRLWIVGADGIGGHELFPGGTAGQSGVAWSPDGTQLVYSERDLRTATDTGTHLYLTDASGSTPQLVDPGCVAPSCSPTVAS